MALGALLAGGFLFALLGNNLFHADSGGTLFSRIFRFTGFTFWCGALGGFFLFFLIYTVCFRDWQKGVRTFSAVLPYFTLGHAFGRLGCFLSGCCFGRPTHSFIGVSFPAGSPASLLYGSEKLYPTQLMELGLLLAISIVLYRTQETERRPGLYFSIYSAGRFLLECFRGDDRGRYLWLLSPAQGISSVTFFVGLFFLFYGEREKESATLDRGGNRRKKGKK